ncbi:MAG: serpin family protein [Candidatus Limnocylindria bacterium]
MSGRAAGDGNTLLSPYSVAAALTMTYGGARGPTAEEMRSVLHLGLPDERVHAARNELDLRITAEPAAPEDGDGEPFAIEVANSLWARSATRSLTSSSRPTRAAAGRRCR